MDIQEIANFAVQYKQEHGVNCCQAVVRALKEEVKLSEEDLLNIASQFGLGMGNMEATCGALIGAGIIAGLASSGDRKLARAINEKFKSLCGAITCEDLKGRFTGKPICSCNDCVKNAVIAYFEVMNNNE